MKLLLYCTKGKPEFYSMNRVYDGKRLFDIVKGSKKEIEEKTNSLLCMNNLKMLNGKIVAECDFEVEKLYCDNYCDERDGYVGYFHALPNDDFEEGEKELQKKSCLDELQINGYLQDKNGYAIHIKNLHIFDEPRDLSYYYTYGKEGWKRIEKAPQNMMYAYELLNFSDWRKNSRQYFYRNAVISIQPQWMCLILNHIKDVEVRKVVLKGMLS